MKQTTGDKILYGLGLIMLAFTVFLFSESTWGVDSRTAQTTENSPYYYVRGAAIVQPGLLQDVVLGDSAAWDPDNRPWRTASAQNAQDVDH